MTTHPTIVWFYRDLRLQDNAALSWAAARGPLIPLYIYDDCQKDGGASLWWLHQSLKNFMHDLSQHNAPLILKRGKSLDVLRALLKQSGAKSVAWARRYEPDLAARDDKIADILQKEGIEVSIQSGFLLFEPEEIKTQSSTPFKVFTPFSKACFAAPSPAVPLSAPIKIQGLSGIESDKLESWKLIPKAARWPKGLEDAWSASEQGASQNLHNFIKERLQFYKTTRDRPDILGTCYHGSSSSVTSIFLKLRTLLTRTSLERILMASSPLHTRLHNRALTKIFQKFPLAR